MKKFGKTEQSVYAYLKEYTEKNSFSPSIREICKALSLKSTSTAHFHLKSLQERGLIKIVPNQRRSIKIKFTDEKPKLIEIPLVGTVSAGLPIHAYDDIQEYYAFPPYVLHGGDINDVFMLTVDGESMINAGILDGDMIVVHKGIASENGDIVVVRVCNDTATVKRIYREDKKVRLQPENSSMEPIYVNYSDITIVGRVIGVFRKYL